MLTLGGSSNVRLKHNFSKQHLSAAEFFANEASRIESPFSSADPSVIETTSESTKSEHRAFVTATVIFSVAYLESSINELFLEAIDRNAESLCGLSGTQVELIAAMWEHVEQASMTTKFDVALASCGAQKFNRAAEPLQSVIGLVKIRNALIHYKPEWHDELESHNSIENRVKSRFPENSLSVSGSMWFPHRCLGSGSARWAVASVKDYMSKFCQRLGVPIRLP
jgi:hypothetical protein